MSRNFNPFQPDVQGNEWLADLEGNPTVPTLGNVPGLTFTPLATDQANADWKWAYCYIFARPEAGAAWLELWKVADIPRTWTTTDTIFAPSEDGTVQNTDSWTGGGVSQTIYIGVDNPNEELFPAVYAPFDRQFADKTFAFGPNGRAYQVGFRYSGVAGTYTDERIVSVTLRAQVAVLVDQSDAVIEQGNVTPFLRLRNGQDFRGPSVGFRSDLNQNASTIEHTWFVNPQTGADWNVSEIEEFSEGTGEYQAGFIVSGTNTPNTLPCLLTVALEIKDAGTDLRQAFAVANVRGNFKPNLDPTANPNNGWVPFELFHQPTGGGDLVEGLLDPSLNDEEYLLLMRRNQGADFGWRYLASTQQPDGLIRPDILGTDIAINQEARLPQLPVLRNRPERAPTIIFKDTQTTETGITGQPYASLDDDAPGPISTPPLITTRRDFWTRIHAANVDTGEELQSIRQEIRPAGYTGGATEDFELVRVFCRLVPGSGRQLVLDEIEPLELELRDDATNTLLASVEIEAVDLTPDRTVFQPIVKEWDSVPTLTEDDLYYITCATAARVSDVGSWAVQVLSGVPFTRDNGPPGGVPATGVAARPNYGTGATGDPSGTGARYSQTVGTTTTEYEDLDAVLSVHTQPETPADFAATLSPTPPVQSPTCETGDADDVSQEVDLTWTATSIPSDEGGGFLRYEIERNGNVDLMLGPDPDSWEVIAKITDQSCESATDRECRLNCTNAYRIRVVRVDLAFSEWSDEEEVTPAMTGDGYVFTSNVAPDHRLWYGVADQLDYRFVERATLVESYQRNFRTRYLDLEDGGDELFGRLLINIETNAACADLLRDDPNCPLTTVGRRVFQPLLELVGNKRTESGQKLTLPYVCVRDRWGNRWLGSVAIPDGRLVQAGGRLYTTAFTVFEVTDVPNPFDKSCAGSGS